MRYVQELSDNSPKEHSLLALRGQRSLNNSPLEQANAIGGKGEKKLIPECMFRVSIYYFSISYGATDLI